MGTRLRSGWILYLAWSFTGCGMLPVGEVAHHTISTLTHSSVRTSDAGPVVIDLSERSDVSVSLKPFSSVLAAMPSGAFFGSSTLRLSQNGDGSIVVRSDGRSSSLLRGLDPSAVNPAVLPFLFPSCEVPANSVGVSY